ncbi:retrotransposon protein, putative, ty1-copia subclass [Tanacetum coccineum]
MGYYFYFPPENKIAFARYAEFLEKNLISQEVSGRAGELENIQDEDTSPFENTSKIPAEVEGFEPPQKEEAPVCRSVRTHQAPERLCLNVEVEEHNLRDLNEPTNYKAAMLDPQSDKWLDAMNAEMQYMKDNQVWHLVDLPPNETFSPVADIRAIRILIAIAAFYDYEIWQMDVKTAFLNGYLDEDIYMVIEQLWHGVALDMRTSKPAITYHVTREFHARGFIWDAFSSTNTPEYIPASPDYSLASPGNTSPDPSDDLSKYLLASLAISPFHNDPYIKVMQAYNATSNELPIPLTQAPIAPPTVLPPSPVLPLFDPQDFFLPEEILPPQKRAYFLSPSSTNFSTHLRYLRLEKVLIRRIWNVMRNKSSLF